MTSGRVVVTQVTAAGDRLQTDPTPERASSLVQVICQGDLSLTFRVAAADQPRVGDVFEVILTKEPTLGQRIGE